MFKIFSKNLLNNIWHKYKNGSGNVFKSDIKFRFPNINLISRQNLCFCSKGKKDPIFTLHVLCTKCLFSLDHLEFEKYVPFAFSLIQVCRVFKRKHFHEILWATSSLRVENIHFVCNSLTNTTHHYYQVIKKERCFKKRLFFLVICHHYFFLHLSISLCMNIIVIVTEFVFVCDLKNVFVCVTDCIHKYAHTYCATMANEMIMSYNFDYSETVFDVV